MSACQIQVLVSITLKACTAHSSYRTVTQLRFSTLEYSYFTSIARYVLKMFLCGNEMFLFVLQRFELFGKYLF